MEIYFSCLSILILKLKITFPIFRWKFNCFLRICEKLPTQLWTTFRFYCLFCLCLDYRSNSGLLFLATQTDLDSIDHHIQKVIFNFFSNTSVNPIKPEERFVMWLNRRIQDLKLSDVYGVIIKIWHHIGFFSLRSALKIKWENKFWRGFNSPVGKIRKFVGSKILPLKIFLPDLKLCTSQN